MGCQKKNRKIAEVAAKYNVPICLMHNRENTQYDNFLEDVKKDLLESVAIAKAASVPDEHIILDPGFGFVKTPAQNLEVLRRIDEIVALGYEVLLGTSRKSTIGLVLGTTPEDRMEGTGATTVYGFSKGCTITRVHDVTSHCAHGTNDRCDYWQIRYYKIIKRCFSWIKFI